MQKKQSACKVLFTVLTITLLLSFLPVCHAADNLTNFNTICDWAEITFPDYFSPMAETFETSGYLIRYYQNTDTYVGTINGEFYVLGGAFGNEVVDVGTMEYLLTFIDPSDIDDDRDGYTENQGDSNDNDATVNPGAVDICGDGIDQDCTGLDTACGKEGASNSQQYGDVYDVVRYGLPKFVTKNYIELSKVFKISKFRSGEGHDCSDDFEDCRSMKHYFMNWEGPASPNPDLNVGYPKVYAPVTGVVTEVHPEWFGYQVHIRSTEYPAFLFMIFHVRLNKNLEVGDVVVAGEEIGEDGPDIAVEVNTPIGRRLVSFIDIITDDVFKEFQDRGVSSRSELIILKETRDLDPLVCDDHSFLDSDGSITQSAGNIESFLYLN